MILTDDLEKLVLDLTCEEIRQELSLIAKKKSKDGFLFNFSSKRLLQLYALWILKKDDGSPEY